MNGLELVGSIAGVLIVISMIMSDVFKLRLINLLGTLLFSYYGFVKQVYPVAALNTICAFVNVYHLFRIYKTNKSNQNI